MATGVLVASNAVAVTLNVLHGVSSEAGGIAAVGTGAVGIAAGATNIGLSGSRGTLGLLNTGVGAASLVLGVIRLMGDANTETPSRLTLAPWIEAHGRTGLAARMEF